MFGNILIDKLRLSARIKEDEFEDAGSLIANFKEKVEKALSSHYRGAYVNYDRGLFAIEFTPTRYLPSVKCKDVDINLDMPNEVDFYRLFEKCGFYDEEFECIVDKLSVVKLHLTKNIILKEPVSDYINFLYNKSYMKGMTPELIKGTDTSDTLKLAHATRTNTSKENSDDRVFILYNKPAEVEEKRNLEYVIVKNPLTEKEVKMLPDGVYNSNSGWLNYKDLNLLRAEMQYKYSAKMKYVAKAITGDKDEKRFSCFLFLDLLKDNKLYTTLDTVYRDDIRRYYFTEDKVEKTITTKEQILLECRDLVPFSLLKPLYKKRCRTTYGALLKKLNQDGITNELYQELYDKLVR